MEPWMLWRCILISVAGNLRLIHISEAKVSYSEKHRKLIETPNIDNLAESGIIFTQHYSGSPVCAPSRCVLLTGKHSGHSYIRGNDEWAARGLGCGENSSRNYVRSPYSC
ncbi:MAG: sulfatase-like hydrolase/transferase [Bacteroidales bacterium]|nr:sulfatase-like hydrolase/transferase [Bacteroidales bacterium]